MKRNKKIMSAFLAMTVFATSVFATPMDAQAASMKLNKTKATIKVGESVTLKVKNKKKHPFRMLLFLCFKTGGERINGKQNTRYYVSLHIVRPGATSPEQDMDKYAVSFNIKIEEWKGPVDVSETI